MKSVAKLKKALNKLNLSYARKADLISKYFNADLQLTSEMNDYFGITDASPRRKAKKKPKPKKIINHSGKATKQTYYGSNARNFDHRARPTPDLHLETDKLLDKEYFKNS